MDTADFISSLGINTHIDFPGMPTVAAHIAAINYLGVKHIRDCAQHVTSADMWRQVNIGTGAKFTAFLPEGSPAEVQAAFALLPDLYRRGLIEMFEGPNEEDDAYAIGRGESLSLARQFQISPLHPYAKSMAKPLINISFGAGWTPLNQWHGDYDKVGDMSPYCDFGNAHTYPLTNQKTTAQIRALNVLAQIAAPGRPVITTEIGWDEDSGYAQATVARNVLQAAFGGVLCGNPRIFFYALYDDAGRFGLMNRDGTAKPAGVALRNLTAILSPPVVRMPVLPAPVVTITPTLPGDRTVALDGLDGSHWLAVWNEDAAARPVAVGLPQGKRGAIYRPLASGVATGEGLGAVVVGPEVVLVRVTGL